MNPEQQRSLLAIALLAAFADGAKDERERDHIRAMAESLAGQSDVPDLTRLYQDVLLKRLSLRDAARGLSEPEHRLLAYEMAVGVCDADGATNAAERRFLDELKAVLGIAPDEAARTETEVDDIVSLSGQAAPGVAATGPAVSGAAAASGPVVAAVPNVSEAELDRSILNYAILNGALELLPQSWASIAIIPLQIKMVYGIGKAHGVELDQGHIREFLATAGVGLTSQYLEQFGRKLLGGLLGKAGGKTLGKLGGVATGMAFSFATTYALGQVARRYYAGGRQMSTALLRQTFQELLGPAKAMQSRYLPQIQETAGGLDAAKVMALVKGG
ncbi:MAG: DUF533 domain-containing protein [Thiobacillaceae bacterium]|jgi:uncharacterized protein (DUF697 family)/tellurite resistance protein|nr:DUF533 domain-containing protein [Thiobacillaceae bacterium]